MEKFIINSETIPPDLEPDESLTLWRYMSFSSLCEILMNNYIPLISVSNFPDKSEGAVLKGILSKLPNFNKSVIEILIERIYRKNAYVSSWHISETENAVMWDRYTHGREGIAIKTNAKLLLESIEDIAHSPKVEDHTFSQLVIKRIKYKKYDPSDFEMSVELLEKGYDKMCFFYKMKDFESEQELRILKPHFENIFPTFYRNFPIHKNIDTLGSNLPNKTSIPLNLIFNNRLIEQIIVSPYAHSKFIETVKQYIRYIRFEDAPRDLIRPILIDPDIVVESGRKVWV